MPKVSVIVPVYNVAEYVEGCLNSLMAQTEKDIEIICVDDGSTDSSGQIVDETARKDKRIKVIHQKNGGLSAARNTGLDQAIGEYVSFCDSDDYFVKNCYNNENIRAFRKIRREIDAKAETSLKMYEISNSLQ